MTALYWETLIAFPYNEACINIFATFSYTRVIYNRHRNIFPSRNDTHLPSPTCISSQQALSRIPLDVNASSQIIRAVYHQVFSFHIAGGLQMEFFFIVHDHKLSHVSYRTGPVEDCKNGKSMAFKSPQLQRTRAVMQTPVSEKPSRNPELYLNTNVPKLHSHKSDLFSSSPAHIELLS